MVDVADGAAARLAVVRHRLNPSYRIVPRATSPIEVLFSSTQAHLDHIANWLRYEFRRHGEGFYVNLRIIREAHEVQMLALALHSGRPVGFAVWFANPSSGRGRIDIASVKYRLRRSGIGTALVEALLDRFATLGIRRVAIECSPQSSASFWRPFGFDRDPDHPYELRHGFAYPKLTLVKVM